MNLVSCWSYHLTLASLFRRPLTYLWIITFIRPVTHACLKQKILDYTTSGFSWQTEKISHWFCFIRFFLREHLQPQLTETDLSQFLPSYLDVGSAETSVLHFHPKIHHMWAFCLIPWLCDRIPGPWYVPVTFKYQFVPFTLQVCPYGLIICKERNSETTVIIT